jgi:dihydrofolate reductase
MKINLITAICKNGGIGYKSKLPWHFKKELQYFSKLTKGNKNRYERNAVLMGHNTWKSLPKRPLEDRQNIVISKDLSYYFSFKNIELAMEYSVKNQFNNLWIIGGKSIYKEFLNNDLVDAIYVTLINKEYDCDVYTEDLVLKLCDMKLNNNNLVIDNIDNIDNTRWKCKYNEIDYCKDILNINKQEQYGKQEELVKLNYMCFVK